MVGNDTNDTNELCQSILCDILDNVTSGQETSGQEKFSSDKSTQSMDMSTGTSIHTDTKILSIDFSENLEETEIKGEEASTFANTANTFTECYICAYPINKNSLCYRKRPLNLPCDCKNIAHADCLLRWITKKGKCPTCRYDFLSTEPAVPGRMGPTGDIYQRHSEFRASFHSLRNSRNIWRRILQTMVIALVVVLRLYVLFLVFGKMSVMILLGLILLYYFKKCYDRRTIVPLNVVFRMPIF